MDPQVAMTLAVLGVVVLALSFLRAAPDLILLGGLTLLIVAGVIDATTALTGFANEGLITVAVLFVVAEGMRQTGGISFIGRRLLGQPNSLRTAQTRIMLPTALMSAFLNNTPVVAIMVPVVGDWARKCRLSVSHLFLPLSYAAILGGMCTLIGTSTTLVVNGLLISEVRERTEALNDEASKLREKGDAEQADKLSLQSRELLETHGLGLQMFEIAWVGVPATIAGLIYVLLSARWLLPERKPAFTEHDDPREYTVEMLVEPGSPLMGKSIEEAGLRHLPGMYLMEIDRAGHVLAAVASNERLQANDRLVFVGVVESVVDLQKIPGLKPATDQLFKLDSPRSERCLIEAVVSNSCPLIRQTIRESKFRSHYNAAVIAVARNGQRIRGKIGDIELVPGDTLLLEAHPSFIDLQRNSRDFFLVSMVQNSTPPRHDRAWISQLILGVMVVSVAGGFLSMLQAAMLAAGLMVLTRCTRWSDAKRSVDWGVLLVIGAGLGIGEAMKVSGTAEAIAQTLIGAAGQRETLVLAIIYGITMVFTNLITAKAAAVLVFPIAMAAAVTLGTNMMPFVIAVIVAAAASFATPIGYQTNLMVYGPGGYRSRDYLRIGGPLSLIIWAITVAVVPLVWKF